jgi:hypothetical protein
LVAVAALAMGVTGVCLVAASGPAGANTPTFTTTCADTPLGTLSFPVVATGSLPTSVKVKTPFKLTDSGLKLTLTNATILGFLAGQTVGGRVVTSLAVKGASPTTKTVTYTLKALKVPSPAPKSLALTATGSTASFTAAKAGKVTVSTTATDHVSLAFEGTTVGPYTCTSSPGSLAIAKTVAT